MVACPACAKEFKTANGMKVHMSRYCTAGGTRIHADEALAKIAHAKTTWTDERLRMVAIIEHKLLRSGTYKSYKELARSIVVRWETLYGEAISFETVRKFLSGGSVAARRYALMRDELVASETPLVEDTSVTTPDPDWRKGLLDWFRDIKSQRYVGKSRHLVDLALEGKTSELKDALEEYFPPIVVVKGPRPKPVNERKTQPEKKLNKRALREIAFRRIQRRLRENRSRTFNELLAGKFENLEANPEEQVTDEEKTVFWRGIFEEPSDTSGTVRLDLLGSRETDWVSVQPIGTASVAFTLRTMTLGAAGPDGIEIATFKECDPTDIAVAYNAILLCGEPPSSFCQSRTVLIPKSDNPTTPGEYRPIAIGNAAARGFHRIISSRIQASVSIWEQQRAFLPMDGCAIQTMIVNCILNDANKEKKPLAMASLDLRKAFDSVDHPTLLNVLRGYGVPEPLVGYIGSYYSRGSTDLLGSRMFPKKGVKQGCPLSPILFNICLDAALQGVKSEGLGYGIQGHRIPCIAYADDVILFAESKAGLQHMCRVIEEGFAAIGLRINPTKCKTIALVKDGKRKRLIHDHNPFLRFSDHLVTALNKGEMLKYLGVMVGYDLMTNPTKRAQEMLHRLLSRALKPQQQIYGLINHLIPKLMHGLVLGKVTRKCLDGLDMKFREAVRRILKLPKDVPIPLFYKSREEGGLGLPNLRLRVPVLKYARLRKVLAVEQDSVIAVTSSASFQRYLSDARKLCSFKGLSLTDFKSERNYWTNSAANTCDGLGLNHDPAKVTFPSDWVVNGNLLSRSARYRQSVRIRLNCEHTRERACRGQSRPPHCDYGCGVAENLSHIVMSCGRTYDWRTTRHDRIVGKLNAELLKRSERVLMEVKLPCKGANRPDLIVWSGGGPIHILDVQVRADAAIGTRCREDPLVRLHEEKKRVYANDRVEDAARRLLGVSETTPVKHLPISLTWRGAMSRESIAGLRVLGVSKAFIDLLCFSMLESIGQQVDDFGRRLTRRRWTPKCFGK